MSNHHRRFPREDLLVMIESGWMVREIADVFGVTTSAIYYALNPARTRVNAARNKAKVGGECATCGKPMTRASIYEAKRLGRPPRCVACYRATAKVER